jgi:molybdenum-dependent DNA-binding transcriptional regulator ModE
MVNGLERAQSLADRVIITPIKLPFVNSATFRLLLDSEAPIAVATCEGVKSEVLAVDTELLTEIISKGGDLSPLHEEAIGIECGDLAVLADVSKPNTDLETLYASSEIHSNMRPISRLCLGFEARFFGPGAAHLIRLIGEKASINKAVDSLGMSYPTFMVIQARIEKALGFKICKQVGLGSPSKSRIIITPEAMEFVEKYERFRALSDVAIQGIFDEVFGADYNAKGSSGL